MNIVANALLPVFLTLLVGYFAAWHHDIEGKAADVLNRMVITYTLPLGLFAGTVTTPRGDFAVDVRLGAILLVGMVVPFAATLLVSRHLFRRSLAASTLQAMAVGLPAIPFVGLPVLGAAFGAAPATATVAVGSLMTNLVMVPLGLILLGIATRASQVDLAPQSVAAIVLASVQQPMVWAPLLGFLLVLGGVVLPDPLIRSINLLGSATAGVALFASGIVLRAQRPTFSLAIAASVVGRLMVVPGTAFAALTAIGLQSRLRSYPVVSLALPCAVIIVIFASRYRVAERESASVLLYSYIASALTLALAIAGTR